MTRGTLAFLALVLPVAASAQTPKGIPEGSLPPPAITFHGLVPGRSTAADVRAALGPPVEENAWYSWKLLYPTPGRPDHLDAVQLQEGKESGLGCVEAASVPPGFETWEKVRAALGEPEWFLELRRSSLADYTAKGARFAFDAQGATIGVAYVPHGRPRVPAGGRRFLTLRSLRQRSPASPDPALPRSGTLEVGTSRVDLTPRAEWLAPVLTGKKFQVHDPLYARCAVLARGDLRIAIVGADLFGMSKDDVDRIEESVRSAGVSHLVFAMAHNHAAPDTIGIYGYYPKDYIAFIQKQVADGVRAALEARRPISKLVAASDELPLDGARVEGLIRNARNPGIVDPQISVLQALDAAGKPLVTFVHFACHVEGLETGIAEPSADFPGYLCDRLEKDLGGRAVFLNGALGGMVSGDTAARTHDEARKAGERFAAEAKRLLATATPSSSDRLALERYPIEVPMTNPRFLLFQKLSNRRPLVDGRIATEMFHLWLGDAELVTVPGELLPQLGFEVEERMTGYPRLVVGLVNDELGYMLPGEEFKAGEYEESMSVGPAIGPMVRDQAIRMAETARDPARFLGPR